MLGYRHAAYPFKPVLESVLQQIVAEGDQAVIEVMTFDDVAEQVKAREWQTGSFRTDDEVSRQAASEILTGFRNRDEALERADHLDETGQELATLMGYMVGGEAIRRAVAVLW